MKGKHFKKLHWNKKRMVCAILCVVLLLTSISFSSMAWYTYKKNEVTQVFKGTTLEITMGGGNDGSTFALVPGAKYPLTGAQIPKATVTKGSVPCYVFVVAEYFWYDMTYYDSTTDKTIYPIDVMNRGLDDSFHNGYYRENDNFKPNRGGVDGDDNDFGFTDFYGWNLGFSEYNNDRTNQEILLDGKVVGKRLIFGYQTFKDVNKTYLNFKNTGITKEDFTPVFETSEQDRFVYILEGNDRNCYVQVMDGIGKIQMPTDKTKLPKIRYTAYTVQEEGLTRDDARDMVCDFVESDDTFKYHDSEKTKEYTFQDR